MGSDNRKVATDALETLGTIIDDKSGRDAIHLAVEPVIAGCTLKPGDDVEIIDGVAKPGENPVGIVDPFLQKRVLKGQRFWLVVYPRQITSLRHVWTHPRFPEAPMELNDHPKTAQVSETHPRFPEAPMLGLSVGNPEATPARKWLESYASELRVTYDELMNHTDNYIQNGTYWSEGSRFEGECLPYEFWDHYEAVTGKVVDSYQKGSFFSCSC
jgi:hypothetical protein